MNREARLYSSFYRGWGERYRAYAIAAATKAPASARPAKMPFSFCTKASFSASSTMAAASRAFASRYESTASSFYGITPSSLATRHEARSMDREKSERSLRLMVESKALAQASTTDYAGGTLGSRVKLVVAMVGLPARGKSYLVKMLVRYLSWVGFPTKIFNVGELRRKQGQAGAKAEYFADTPEAMAVREGLALQCQEEMYDWLRAQKGACVAIFDATNTTRHRRHLLTERCKAESDESGNDVSIVFVESICDDPKVLSRNYEMKLQNARARRRQLCCVDGAEVDAIDAAQPRTPSPRDYAHRRAATAVPRRPTTRARTPRRPWLILWKGSNNMKLGTSPSTMPRSAPTSSS